MKNNIFIDNFALEVDRFKNWIKDDLEYYLKKDIKSNGETYVFWDRLIKSTKNIIVILDDNYRTIVNNILYVLAIDNEGEIIKDYIIKNCNDKQIELIISIGYNYYLADTRWQIAVIIKERYLPKYEKYLEALKNDTNSYVRKRAK